MTTHENIAKALQKHLSELTGRVAEINSNCANRCLLIPRSRQLISKIRMRLRASKILKFQEIRQIEEALKQDRRGTYGVCTQCGADIDPKRLKALPIATRCISCAA